MNKNKKSEKEMLADQEITAAGQTDHPVVESGIALQPAAPGVPADSQVGKIILKGAVTLAVDREGIEQAVRSCAGVIDIDNQIQVTTDRHAL